MEEADVDVVPEHVDIRERGIVDAHGGMVIVQQLADVVAALPHAREPCPRNRAEIARALLQPRVDGRVALQSSGKLQNLLDRKTLSAHAVRILRPALCTTSPPRLLSVVA